MKTTYTRTMFIEDLTTRIFKLYINEYRTYVPHEDESIVEYRRVKAWSIIEGGKEAEEIEAQTDGSCIDENHSYLILHFEDGSEKLFRNSHVDMYIR